MGLHFDKLKCKWDRTVQRPVTDSGSPLPIILKIWQFQWGRRVAWGVDSFGNAWKAIDRAGQLTLKPVS